MNKRGCYAIVERIFFLSINPNISKNDYCKKFEISSRTYWRDVEFIKTRIWKYEIKEKKHE